MRRINPYRFAFFLVVAATLAVGALEAWGAIVDSHEFDPRLVLGLALILIPLYVMKRRSEKANRDSSP
jgi:hypothetical protein